MTENNDGMSYAILGFIIIIVIVIALFFVFNKVVNSNNKDINYTIGEPQHFTIQAKCNDKLIYNVDYELYNQGNLIQKGKLKKGFVERVNELRNNTNYTLIIKSRDYYEEKITCNSNQFTCSAYIDKYPEIDLRLLELEENYYRVFIYLKNGILKNPALCIADNTFRIGTISITNGFFKDIELLQIKVPERLKLFYDKCYYPHTNVFVKENLWKDLELDYEYNIKKYNKEFGTEYTMFSEVKWSNDLITSFISDQWSEGIYEFDLKYEIDTLYGFNQDSILKFVLIDQYELTKYDDVDVPDEECVIELYD